MSGSSSIEWTDATWNPVTGCTRVSPGCAHCYIERTPPFRMAGRRFEVVDGEATTGVTLHPDRLEQPLRWRKPRRVFVNSLSDLFHDEVPDDYIAQVFDVMANAGQHTFQVLTKRPERARDLLRAWDRADDEHNGPDFKVWPLENVWIGVSIENARYTWRADVLREIPAAVRFISAEPLLGSLYPPEAEPIYATVHNDAEREVMEALLASPGARAKIERTLQVKKPLDLTGIDWVIVGGESGPGARPMHPDWPRELRDACLGVDDHGYLTCDACRRMTKPEILDELCDDRARRGCVRSRRPAFFFKQWGGATPKSGGRELDGRTWDEMPAVTAP